jgi:mono/diheme cytochrome c family protein/glucose/arabinose dehydrogenase
MKFGLTALLACLLPSLAQAAPPGPTPPAVEGRIVLLGGGLGSRMAHFGHFETGLHVRFPDHRLFVRNMCDEGNTPSFRPHSGRGNQLGFPGAEKFAVNHTGGKLADGQGHLETEEQWLARLKPDTLIAFFGFSEAYRGPSGLEDFRAELDAFVVHTLQQKYNGIAPPRLVLVSPTAVQDLSARLDVPNGQRENKNFAAYTAILEAVAHQRGVHFVNAFAESQRWYAATREPLTSDGTLLNDAGYARLSEFLLAQIFGDAPARAAARAPAIRQAVQDLNWLWQNDFKIPNGVHVFGRRYKPFGPDNYPFELEKIREMAAIRDEAIWAAAQGKPFDVAARDAQTRPLPPVATNYSPSNNKNGALEFLKGQEALDKLSVPAGYAIQQFATEQDFPNLANPVQLAFDNRGRLWVATMPSYPHWRPGDPRPDDKLLILEDTNGDGKADKETVWADKLHLPMGFEIAAEGVYVSQGVHLKLLRDTDGDDRADTTEIVFSGFDDHDTHHAISAFCADPSGAIFMAEGVFLRTHVDTPYGPVRGSDGGFYRFSPQRRHLERHAQLSIPNPWGIAFDDWGQHFFLHTSGPPLEWMLPGSIQSRYGEANPGSANLVESAHRVRPTSGLEFVSSRHFPPETQGDILICNNIGFLGIKQHQFAEEGTGYTTRWRHDLLKSSDGNFRPVDLEFAPDGSLFVVDWHNPLIGHMQHNARDPNRDHAHGRVYRIHYPGRPLVTPPKVAGAPLATLLENLKLPESRARDRSRRELRGRKVEEVLPALNAWAAALDRRDPHYEHHLLEALYVSWGANRVHEPILRAMLKAKDHRARAAAVRVLRYSGHQVKDAVELLKAAAADPHGRVKLEAVAAASWLGKDDGLAVLDAATGAPPPAPAATPAAPASAVTASKDGMNIRIVPPVTGNAPISGFTLTVPGDNRTINLAEMELRAGGKNITGQAKFSQSSEYNQSEYPVRNLTDGNKGNFSHTAFQRDPWIKVEFPSPTRVDEILIWNRNGFTDRIDGAQVVFHQGDRAAGNATIRIEGGSGGSEVGKPGTVRDSWIGRAFDTARARLNNQPPPVEAEAVVSVPAHLRDAASRALFSKGAEIYAREGHCGTCHQPDGNGLPPAGFPPLAKSFWVTGSEERLIKLTLNGLMGPMEVNGVAYPGLVPMTPFAGMLNDEEIASVLTFVRNSFGNQAPPVQPAQVAAVRKATAGKVGFYSPAELLLAHPEKP